MDPEDEIEHTFMRNRTTVERKSERELVAARTVDGPVRLVFEAWTKPELLKQWWVPKSSGLTLLSCETDVRTGGTYRLEFAFGAAATMVFFGTYLEVSPCSRLVWTNEEVGGAGQVTTVTFEEFGGNTLVVMHELYPSKEALDSASDPGSQACTIESFEQLNEFVVSLAASA